MHDVVYRFFDDDDSLLYVGMTIDSGRRYGDHRRRQPWWGEVTRIMIERHPDRQAARRAELLAIRTEQPRYNVADTQPLPEPGPPRLVEEATAALTDLHRLVNTEDLTGLDTETLADGVRAAEFAFNHGDEWSGRFVAELRRRDVSWSKLVELTGQKQTTLHRRFREHGERAGE